MNNTNALPERYRYSDVSGKTLFRKSALMRVLLGTSSSTFVAFLYSLSHARWRGFHFSFVKNWLKGSLAFSFMFYTGNEVLYAVSNYYHLYTNFWVNYSLLAYTLSKAHYRYLIRNNLMKWYLAIKYSHKCFLYFLVANLIIELFIKLNREVYLYQEEDLFDIIRQNYKDPVTNKPNFEMTYEDLEKNFMKSFQIFNSPEKNELLTKNLKLHKNGNNISNRDLMSQTPSANNSQKFKTGKPPKGIYNLDNSPFKIRTVDIFDLYKNNKV